MSQRMIFFPHKRRAVMLNASLVAASMAVTAAVFLAGVHVGVQNAGVISQTAPLLIAELVTFQQ